MYNVLCKSLAINQERSILSASSVFYIIPKTSVFFVVFSVTLMPQLVNLVRIRIRSSFVTMDSVVLEPDGVIASLFLIQFSSLVRSFDIVIC